MAWVVPRAHEMNCLLVKPMSSLRTNPPARLLAYRDADDETMMLLPSHVEETTTEQLPR
jgi:hypothetical protein